MSNALRVVSVLLTALSVLVIALLMGSHMPFQLGPVAQAASARRTGHWQAFHILGPNCPCSTRAGSYLAGRARMQGVEETVLQVGDEPETDRTLREAGWRVEKVTAEHVFAAYGVRSAPMLVVVDPSGAIRYRGGYARRSDGRDGYRDVEIGKRVRAGEEVPALAAYGCALTFGCALGGVKEVTANLEK